jgi:hypothetical protein
MPKEYINPPGVPQHPYFTLVLTVTAPSKLVYIAGQVPSDGDYKPVHVGDIRAQFIAVLDSLTVQLKAIGASWDDAFRPANAIGPTYARRARRGRLNGSPRWGPSRIGWSSERHRAPHNASRLALASRPASVWSLRLSLRRSLHDFVNCRAEPRVDGRRDDV